MTALVRCALGALILIGALAGVAPADAASKKQRSCGTVTAANKEKVRLSVRGTTCAEARRVMTGYYARARAGACRGKGNSCTLKVRRYECATRTFGDIQRTGLVTSCKRGSRVLQTRTTTPSRRR